MVIEVFQFISYSSCGFGPLVQETKDEEISLFPCLLHQHRFSLITPHGTNENPPETKKDAYYSSIHSDNDSRYAEGENYPGIQENQYASLDDYNIYVNVNPQPSVARQATFKVNSAYEGK